MELEDTLFIPQGGAGSYNHYSATELSGKKINVIGYGICTIIVEKNGYLIVSSNLSGRTFKVEQSKTESI